LKKVRMGQVMRSRSISPYFLLIAAAVQGLTPDANDLTSTTLFPLLASLASGTAGAAVGRDPESRPDSPRPHGASLPSCDQDGDPMPGEVCGPARFSAGQIQAHHPGGTPRLGPSRIDPQRPPIRSNLLDVLPRHGGMACGDDLTLVLRRFLC
jgi:hypothetical protein